MKFMKTAASLAIIASMAASAAFAGWPRNNKAAHPNALLTETAFRQDGRTISLRHVDSLCQLVDRLN